MNVIPHKLVDASSKTNAAAWQVYERVRFTLQRHSRVPDWLIGDLVLALTGAHPMVTPDDEMPQYSQFLIHLVKRSARWHYVVVRLAGLFRGTRSQELWVELAAQVVDWCISLLLQYGADNLPEDPATEEGVEALAEAYNELAEELDDFSLALLNDLKMAQLELARRARSLQFLLHLQAEDLLKECLATPLDANIYDPRLLREVLRQGDRNPRLPGDHQSLSEVSLKVREDQIPKILPSELAMNRWKGKRGQWLTADKVLNRQPTIYQNHDTQRPELDHKILIVFLNSAAHHPSGGIQDELRAKAMGYCLLANAALAVPHESIHADVAWFQRDDPNATRFEWGAQFRLRALKVTRSEPERWRNALEIDRVLPRLFINAVGAIRPHATADFTMIRENPTDFLNKSCYGKYHGIFLASIGSEQDGAPTLPAASTPLPELPPGTPTVMLITASRDGRHGMRGSVFPTLLAARMAPAVLPLAPDGTDPHLYFVEEFLKMIVGPLKHKAAVAFRPIPTPTL